MADRVFNVAKGSVGEYAKLAGTNDAIIIVPIETSGIVDDDVMVDYSTLAALLAGTSNEQTTMGRKVLSTATRTVDTANDRVDADVADVTWAGATGNAISALVICYDPDTTVGTDSSIIPLTKHDFFVTPAGVDIVAQFSTSGFFRAT